MRHLLCCDAPVRNLHLLRRLRGIGRRRPEFVGDEWMLDWINGLIDRGEIPPETSLADLIGPGQLEHDRLHGIPTGH